MPWRCRATRWRRRSERRRKDIRLDLPIRRSSTRSSRTSPTCRATITRRRCKAGICRCSARSAPNMVVDVAYVGNRAEDMLLFANYNQAVPNNAAGTLTLQQRRPIQDWADITYAFNGGKSRYKALMVKYEWRLRGGVSVLSSTTFSEAKDNGAGTLENQNGNAPSPQDFRNIDADFGLVELPPALQQHDELRLGAARRSRRAMDGQRVACARSARRRMAVRRHQLGVLRRAGDLHLHAGGGSAGVRHHAGFPGTEHFPSEPRSAIRIRRKAEQTITNWFNRDAVVVPTDISQPFGNAPRNNVRGPVFWQIDFAMSKHFAITSIRRISSSDWRRSICSIGRISGRPTATAAPAPSARSRRPTIHVNCSWASS